MIHVVEKISRTKVLGGDLRRYFEKKDPGLGSRACVLQSICLYFLPSFDFPLNTPQHALNNPQASKTRRNESP